MTGSANSAATHERDAIRGLLPASGLVLELLLSRATLIDATLGAATPAGGSLALVGEYETRVCWHDSEELLLTRHGIGLRSSDIGSTTEWAMDEHASATHHTALTPVMSHFAGDLPDGRLRWKIESVAGLKPLIVHLEANVTCSVYRVLDKLEKTIAVMWVESAAGTGGARWVSVRVHAMRGFDAHLRRTSKKAEAIDGIALLDRPLLKAVGKSVTTKPRSRPKLDAASTPRAAMLTALRPIAEEIRDLLAPTLADLDPAFLHDLRVNVRRTRSALRIAEGALAHDEIRTFNAGFAWLGEITSPQRELDVYLESLPVLAESLAANEVGWLNPFHELLSREREREHAALQQHLRSPRLEHLVATWERLLTPPKHGFERGKDGSKSERADRFSQIQLRAVLAEVVSEAEGIDDSSADTHLHDLRKLCKRMRYTVDLFSSLYPARHLAALTAELKRFQEYLGAFQDLCDQRDGLLRFAHAVRASDGPTSTILAMGRLAAMLDQRTAALRTEYATHAAAFLEVARSSRFSTLEEVPS